MKLSNVKISKVRIASPVDYDVHFSDVVLLLHMNGANGSTTFVDSSPTPKTVTANGGAQISTAQSKFGSAGGYFDGTAALSVSGLSSLNQFTASGQIGTIECWVRFDLFNDPRMFIFGSYGTGQQGWTLDVVGPSPIAIRFAQDTTIISTINISPLSINTWYHFALVNTGSNLVFYINGVNVGSVANYSVTSATQDFRIGARRTTELPLYGYIDDFRITQGVARYVNNFTPPTRAFPDYGGRILFSNTVNNIPTIPISDSAFFSNTVNNLPTIPLSETAFFSNIVNNLSVIASRTTIP